MIQAFDRASRQIAFDSRSGGASQLGAGIGDAIRAAAQKQGIIAAPRTYALS